MLYHTITNIKDIILQDIDNRNGNLKVGLKSITYTVGWYNVKNNEYVLRRRRDDETRIDVPPGLYSFDQLQEIINNEDNIILTVNESNAKISLNVADNFEIFISDGLLKLIGLDGLGWLNSGIYAGSKPIDFGGEKILNIHLDKISTTGNLLNGAPSTLLTTIGLGSHSFGDVKTITFDNPAFKNLQNGLIHELKLSIKDINNNIINNNNLPIYITLEIK